MRVDCKSPEGQAFLNRAFKKKKSPSRKTRSSKKAAADTPKHDVVFFALLKSCGLPLPRPEYHFHEERLWRADYAWEAQRILLEVEGGIWTQGRHVRGKGYKGDMQKYTAAALDWWRVFRVEPDELSTMATIELLKKAFENAHYLQLPPNEEI